MARDDSYRPTAAYVDGVAGKLAHLPMATAADLGQAFGQSGHWTHVALEMLEEQGRARSVEASMGRARARRWWLDPGDPASNGWHNGRTMLRLVNNPTLVAWTYYLLPLLLDEMPGRELKDFMWVHVDSFEAAARFNDGWVAFAWSGYWQNRAKVRGRFAGLADSLRLGESEERSWPSKICVLAPDVWQSRMVMDVAREFGMADLVCVCATDDKLLFGDLTFREGRGWMMPPLTRDSVDVGSVEGALKKCLFSDEDGIYLSKVGNIVEQWPGIRARWICGFAHLSGGLVKSALDKLERMGLVSCQDGEYSPTKNWLSMSARRDRVWSGLPARYSGRQKAATRINKHEQGVMRVVSRFAGDGCGFAPGWRCVDVMGGGGSVTPDAVVWIEQGPFGAGWHYLEYELRAKTLNNVQRKLRSYRSALRGDRYPLLMVCQRGVEQSFWDEGAGLEMLTTTVREAASGPLAGVYGTVWRRFGEPVPVLSGRAPDKV